MVVEASGKNVNEVVDCREDDGALRNSVRANNRKLFWEDICSELIDNALEHSNSVCNISLEWGRQSGENIFRVIDDGKGSEDIRAFFKPGKSVITGKPSGNSTFGMGLFVCECCISSEASFSSLRIATCSGGESIISGRRVIDVSSAVKVLRVPSTEHARNSLGIKDHGTNLYFNKFSKGIPDLKGCRHIAKSLGKTYSTAISTGQLCITIIRSGVNEIVAADKDPEVADLKTMAVEIDGYTFGVEWGVTKDVCRDNGCRLIYGGKFFDTTDAPCNQYNIGRFYAAIRIPRDIGTLSMDILKRCVDHPVIDELYNQCSVLFLPELIESDAICRAGEDKSLNADISHLLSVAIKPDASSSESLNEVDGANKRTYKGRDMTKKGVKSTGTGTKHRRSKRNIGIPDECSVFWAKLGEDKGLAVYQHDTNRITFNEDAEIMLRYREEKNKILLASIAAGHIAKAIEHSSRQSEFGFGDKDFVWIYRVMMERVAASC